MAEGGKLTLQSTPGEGTTITAEIPLSRPLSVLPLANAERQVLARPSIESWSWLGQRLVIPVGQVWPWLPADQAHLRQPLIETGLDPLAVFQHRDWFGLRTTYILSDGQQYWMRLSRWMDCYFWRAGGGRWKLENMTSQKISGPRLGQMVLKWNGQPLAAMQYQGRLLNTWSEIVYDGHGYRLSFGEDWRYRLCDESGEELLTGLDGPPLQIKIERPIPQSLLLMAAVRMMDEKNLS